MPGPGACWRHREGCLSLRSPAAGGAGSLIKRCSVIRIRCPAQETLSGRDHRCAGSRDAKGKQGGAPPGHPPWAGPRRGLTDSGQRSRGRGSWRCPQEKHLAALGARPPLSLSRGHGVGPGPPSAQGGTGSRPVGRPHGDPMTQVPLWHQKKHLDS